MEIYSADGECMIRIPDCYGYESASEEEKEILSYYTKFMSTLYSSKEFNSEYKENKNYAKEG